MNNMWNFAHAHSVYVYWEKVLTHWAPTPQNGQTHSDNLSAIADKLFECILPFCGLACKGLRFG